MIFQSGGADLRSLEVLQDGHVARDADPGVLAGDRRVADPDVGDSLPADHVLALPQRVDLAQVAPLRGGREVLGRRAKAGAVRRPHQQRLAQAAAAVRRLHVQVLEVEPRLREEGREVLEVQRERDDGGVRSAFLAPRVSPATSRYRR